MTTVEYDLDSSGGLMAKIQALIAPPESDEASKNKKKEGLDLHPYFKRPGKGHNRDCCDSCGEGGNLICCDKCPASFHLTCHDPPLEDNDIPLGEWLCHCCRLAAGLPSLSQLRAQKVKDEPSSKDESENSSSQTNEDSPPELITRASRTRLASSAAAAEPPKPRGKPKAQTNADKATSAAGAAARAGKTKPLELLVAAASSMNPRQFELPREMLVPIVFPGTDKVGPMRPGRRASTAKKKPPYELDNNGLVPLPAKLCYECRQSCRKAPLVACDYCPLFFHQDCLDPPLTAMPAGRWMCPNHHEPFLEEKTLTSVSVTERVRLWDQYAGPLDPEAVKTEFFRKVRRKHPPFRFKVRLAPRARVRVPNSVREQYRVRPQLIPSLRDVLRQEARQNRLQQPNITGSSTEEEQDVWLSSVVALQTSIACHLATKRKRKAEEAVCEVKEEVISDDEVEATERLLNGEVQKPVDKSEKSDDSQLRKKLLNGNDGLECKTPKLSSNQETSVNEKTETKSTKSNESSKISKDEQSEGSVVSDAMVESLTNKLESSLDDSVSEDTLSQLDSRLVRLLALQRLRQLSTSGSPVEDFIPKPTVPLRMPVTGLRPRALLTPLSGTHPPVPIYYRVIEIGSGGDMDVCLSRYGHCNFLTSKHAVIICDEVNKHYELMNYSEHGTTVDNVLYSCDFSEKGVAPITGVSHGRQRQTGLESANQSAHADQEIPPLIQRVREVVAKRRHPQVVKDEPDPVEEETLPACVGKTEVKCGCRTPGTSLIGGSGAGWEGTALLNHGSFIKFGCIQFTFSITCCAPALPPPTNHYAPLVGPLSERVVKVDDSSSIASGRSSVSRKSDAAEERQEETAASLTDKPSAKTPPSPEKDSDAEDEDNADECEDADMKDLSLPFYSNPKVSRWG